MKRYYRRREAHPFVGIVVCQQAIENLDFGGANTCLLPEGHPFHDVETAELVETNDEVAA